MDENIPQTENRLSSLAKHSFRECEAMAKFALSSGLKVSGKLLQRLQTLEIMVRGNSEPNGEVMSRLGDCHNQLSRLVAPATPRTILLLDSEAGRNGFLSFLGPMPLIRQLMVTAIFSLAMLICITLSPNVNGSNANSDILVGSGMSLLLNELFLLSAAALGASFSALFIANRYIQEGTFDPRYNISYWIRFVLGLIGGFILATLIDIEGFRTSTSDVATAASPFARPLLAMLGGFSANLLYRILNRLTESVESIFQGDLRAQVKTITESERAQLKTETEQNRSRLAYRLMVLQQKMNSGDSSAAIQEELTTLVRDLIGEDTEGTDKEAEVVLVPSQ